MLSFAELLDAVDKRELYEEIDELKQQYQIYCAIGGYSDVVNCYLDNRGTSDYAWVLYQVIRIFIEESSRYFSNILSMILFG